MMLLLLLDDDVKDDNDDLCHYQSKLKCPCSRVFFAKIMQSCNDNFDNCQTAILHDKTCYLLY